MNTFVRLLLITLCSTALLTPHVQAETLTWRVYNYVTALHVMPIGFEKVPANVLLERRGIAEFPNGETAAYLTRGSAKMTPVAEQPKVMHSIPSMTALPCISSGRQTQNWSPVRSIKPCPVAAAISVAPADSMASREVSPFKVNTSPPTPRRTEPLAI